MTSSAHTDRWRAFALLAVAFFMTTIDLTIVNTSLPTIGRHLHFAETSLLWVVTAYGLAYGGFLLLGGRAADLLGRRRIFIAGLALFTAASLGCAVAASEGVLIAMRALQGLGAAMLIPAALSSVRNMFSEGAERNRALGIWGALGAGGASVGIILGGLLTRYVGWRYVFFINVPVGATALLLAPRVVPESRLDGARRRFDPAGAVTVTAGLVLLVYGISQAPRYDWGATRTIAVLAGAAVLLAAFLAIERRAEAPLLPLRIFRLRTLAGANAGGLLLGASFYAFIFTGTLYMQQVLGYSPMRTGLAYIASTASVIVFAGVAQNLVTRFGVRRILPLGLVLATGALAYYSTLPLGGSYWAILMPAFLATGVGLALSFIPVTVGALTGVRPHEAGIASGAINTSQQIGGAIGLAVASTIASTFSSRYLSAHPELAAKARALHLPSPQFLPQVLDYGFHHAFYLLAALTVLGAGLAVLLVEPKEEVEAQIEATAGDEDPQPVLT
jgi:EmrB/QacA subfamily drug resistance transporter